MERIEEVCRSKGLSKKEWSRAAGFAPNYLATVIRRASADPEYVLPEDGAEALARVAGVSVEWLRRGIGPSIVESSRAALPAAREAPPTTMESAILEAWRRTDFPTEIVVALQGLARASRTRFPERQEEAVAVAMRWLRAAHRLMRDGQPITWETLAVTGPLVDLADAAASVGIDPPATPVRVSSDSEKHRGSKKNHKHLDAGVANRYLSPVAAPTDSPGARDGVIRVAVHLVRPLLRPP